VGLGDRPNDREAEPGAAARAGRVAAGEALEGAIGQVGREARTAVGHLQLDAPVGLGAAGAQHDLAAAVAEGVVNEVPERLAEAELVRLHAQPVAALHADVPPALPGAVAEAHAHALQQGPHVEPLAPHR
jgi:hypothetical protein